MLLSEVKKGGELVVAKFACTGESARRLMDFGIFKGTTLKVLGFAPLGDPMLVEVGDSQIALRKSDAKNIIAG